MIHHDKYEKTGKPIVCSKCGSSGGTLVKVEDTVSYHYEHQNKMDCSIMQMRKVRDVKP